MRYAFGAQFVAVLYAFTLASGTKNLVRGATVLSVLELSAAGVVRKNIILRKLVALERAINPKDDSYVGC